MQGQRPSGEPDVESWVWTENLHPWVQTLGHICGYGLDDLDWAMIDLELEATDAGDGRWFDHRLGGYETIEVSLAVRAAVGMTSVRVWCPDQLRTSVELATHMGNTYRIR